MLKILLTIMLILTTSLIFSHHPVYQITNILLQTLVFCMTLNSIICFSWFSYILFLTFMGGILILFIYVVSLISNQIILMKTKKMIKISMMMVTLSIMILFLKETNMPDDFLNFKYTPNLNKIIYMNSNTNFKFISLYTTMNFKLSILMMIYLFMCLLSIMKIINTKKNIMLKI